MFRKIFAVAAFATVIATPTLAAEAPVRSFVRDGVRYSYKTIEKNGVTVLQGTADNRIFRFEIRGDKVTGTANGESVAFTVSDLGTINADNAAS